MPIKYVCRNCGTILHKFEKVGQDFYGVRTPSEIKSIFGGRCPRCGHELGTPTLDDIKINLKKKVTKVMVLEQLR
ncbi:hypothetical protein [Saccharolobus shibatae]|uniref:hypothetical protein n=1 Tax=Saccharolobus shibatae TaxID=2286 RepID=UPI001C471A5A|nr:hypothetical protein [Saccharolobus shibatae]